MYSSTDGVNWTNRTPTGTFRTLFGVTYGTQFVAVGLDGNVFSSADGVNWTNRTSNTFAHLYGVACSRELNWCVAVGNGAVISSIDGGNTWGASPTLISGSLSRVIWNGSSFLAVGNNGKIVQITKQ
jgi:hypothetical protein